MEPTYCDPEEVSLSSQMLNHRYRHKYVNQRDSTLKRSKGVKFCSPTWFRNAQIPRLRWSWKHSQQENCIQSITLNRENLLACSERTSYRFI